MFGWIFRRARRLSVREHLRLHELLQTKGCASSVVFEMHHQQSTVAVPWKPSQPFCPST